jgi:hypothetical protein
MRGSPRYATDHSAVQRECALYRIYVLDPRTNYKTICLGYIGETAREPFVRFLEHLYDQPFGDTIVGAPEVDPQRFTGKAEVLEAERLAVEAERPLYNHEWNLDNPDRIPIPVACRQRAERDRARGGSGSAAAGRRRRAKPVPRSAPAPIPIRANEPHWMLSRPAVYVYCWLALAAAVGWVLSTHGITHGWDGAEVGAGVATSVCALFWFRRPVTRRRDRRGRR